METLRSTIVHSALRPSNEAPRSLLDFIDESSFDTLHSTIESTLDSASTTHRTFKASQDAFTAECEVLLTYIKAAAPPISKRGENPIPSLLGELHTHAEQMAHLLMSLNSHYDLCADAVRHTEGGFLALQNAKTGNRIPDGVSVSNVLPSPDSSTKIAPLSSEERRQMLAVIDADAAELPDVIADLNARLSEMEVVLPGILAFVSKQRATYKSITSTFRALLTIGKRLPTYISASTIFHTHWCPLLTTLSSQVSELDQVRDFYIGYLSSYDQLILEAARRRNREEKIKEVLQSALEKVEKMRKRDTKERERFRREVGDFLPADLWGGLRRDAPVWEVVVYGDGFEGENEEGEGKLDKAEEDVGMSTPSLPGEIVDAARRREADRGLGLVI